MFFSQRKGYEVGRGWEKCWSRVWKEGVGDRYDLNTFHACLKFSKILFNIAKLYLIVSEIYQIPITGNYFLPIIDFNKDRAVWILKVYFMIACILDINWLV